MNTQSLSGNSVLVEAIKLEKSYQLGKISVPALRGVDFIIKQGEFVAVEGPSGSGKTTLLNLIGAIDVPTGGDILLSGRSLSGLTEKELSRIRRDLVGFIFQSFNLIPVLNAIENVEFPLLVAGKDNRENRLEKCKTLLEEVGLGEYLDRRPSELSGQSGVAQTNTPPSPTRFHRYCRSASRT